MEPRTYEKTFVLIKPDAIGRKLVGHIIRIFEEANLDLLAAKLTKTNKKLAYFHYKQNNPNQWARGVREKTINIYSK